MTQRGISDGPHLPWREWGVVMDLNPLGQGWRMVAWFDSGRGRAEAVGSTPRRAFSALLDAMDKLEVSR